jgi:hypothetical protein
MVKYVCDKCKENFTKKSVYNTHIKKCNIVLEDTKGILEDTKEVLEDTISFHIFDTVRFLW